MRKNWISYLQKVAEPVLKAGAEDKLKEEMPVYKGRKDFQYLEAIGRIFCGIAPWLQLPLNNTQESLERQKYQNLFCKAISNLVDLNANDYVDFSKGSQALVDTSYLAQGFLRAPSVWGALKKEVQQNIIYEIKKTRIFTPPKNNWLLFSATIEAFLLEYDKNYHKKRLYYGVKKFVNSYYIGDGMYGDGASLSIDYYNSYVIHPMLLDVLHVMVKHKLKRASKLYQAHFKRYQRYIQIQERMISPEGAYPVFGRTLICRFGVFHALSQASLLNILPKNIAPSQVRCALNAVLNRHFENQDNFDSKGFMTVGFNGVQENMSENYVSSGSAYHCSTIFLPLGLPKEHEFWSEKAQKWTSLKAFTGEEFEADHAVHEKNQMKEFYMKVIYKLQSVYYKMKSLSIK